MRAASTRHGRNSECLPGFRIWGCAAKAHIGLRSEAKAEFEKTLEIVAADWHGKGPPTPSHITRWLLHMFPIAVRDDWERLRRGPRRGRRSRQGHRVRGVVTPRSGT